MSWFGLGDMGSWFGGSDAPASSYSVAAPASYRADDFRKGSLPGAHSGPVARHKLDCEVIAAFANKSGHPGPKYGADTVRDIRDAVHTSANTHYYGSSTANNADRHAVNSFLNERPLTAHQAAHIRAGAEVLAAARHDLPEGFVNAAKAQYSTARDVNGRRVVDTRMFNNGRG